MYWVCIFSDFLAHVDDKEANALTNSTEQVHSRYNQWRTINYYMKVPSLSNYDFAKLRIRLDWGWLSSILLNHRIHIENPCLEKLAGKMELLEDGFSDAII
jgi:hypothetical protein